MSVTVDVFIRFKGSKPALRRILADDFLIATEQKKYFFLNYIEVGLSHRRDDPGYFEGREFRPYDFILWGTTYVWSAGLGTAGDAASVIMGTLAQMLAVRLKTRTMVCIRDFGMERRYRCVRPMKRNRMAEIVDENTGQPPKGLF